MKKGDKAMKPQPTVARSRGFKPGLKPDTEAQRKIIADKKGKDFFFLLSYNSVSQCLNG